MNDEKTNYYKGKYELDISSGVIALPIDIINSWKWRNLGPKGKEKPVYFNVGAFNNLTSEKYLRLYDPKITRSLMNTGLIEYEDFISVRESEHDCLRTRWQARDNGLIIPENIREVIGEENKVLLVGLDNYVDILRIEALQDYERENSLEELPARVIGIAYSI